MNEYTYTLVRLHRGEEEGWMFTEADAEKAKAEFDCWVERGLCTNTSELTLFHKGEVVAHWSEEDEF